MNRGVWWATVHEVAELDTTEQLTHTNILGWEIPQTEEPGGLQSWGHKRAKHNLVTRQLQFQEGRTKSNVMSPKWSAQLAWSGAEWDSAGNVFFKCHGRTSLYDFDYLYFLQLAGQRGLEHPPPRAPEKRLSPPLPGYCPHPMPISPVSTHADSQPPNQPHRQRREGWFLPDPTPPNIKHPFSFHHPTEVQPIICTNVITFSTKLLPLFQRS